MQRVYRLSQNHCHCSIGNQSLSAKGKQLANSKSLYASVSKRVLVQNLSHEDEFGLHENDLSSFDHDPKLV